LHNEELPGLFDPEDGGITLLQELPCLFTSRQKVMSQNTFLSSGAP